MQNDIPAGSLKFEYTKLDLFDKHGGYTSVSFDTEAMNVTFYDSKGVLSLHALVNVALQ